MVPEGRLVERDFATDLVAGPVGYAVLLPEGCEEVAEPLPLLYLLHGGNGNGLDMLKAAQPIFERLWREGQLPQMAVVAPSGSRSFWMDYRDGSQKWEQVLVGPFLEHIRRSFNVRSGRAGTCVSGVSMGGMGSLRLALKHPDVFAGVAALEPGIEPALAFSDITLEDRFWRSEELFETIYGKPVDEAYWSENNPASIALRDAESIRASGLSIYLECGDEGAIGLHRGTEFLHRVLRDNGVPHEYHLVLGTDHLGRSLGPRMAEAFRFIGAVVDPPGPDPVAADLQETIATMKESARRRTDGTLLDREPGQ